MADSSIYDVPLHTLQLCAWKSMTPSPLPSTSFSRSRIIPFPKVSSTWHGWQRVRHQAHSSASTNGHHGFTFSPIGSLFRQNFGWGTMVGIKGRVSQFISQLWTRPTTVPRSCGAPSSTRLGRSCHHRSLGFLNSAVRRHPKFSP